jgi:death on curing protein
MSEAEPATPNDCIHLTMDIVREIHAKAIARFGGAPELRDMALLESAVAAPQAGVGGQSVFVDVVEIAAAYLFYLCRNHPFVDGNKRTALAACLVFLRLNGIAPSPDGPAWERLTMAVASSAVNREETTTQLRLMLP